MADSKISALPAVTTPLDTDEFAVNQSGSKKENRAQIVAGVQASLASHTGDTSNPHTVTKTQVGLGNVADLKVNLTATAAPTATDDTGAGYSVGSMWIDTTNDRVYVLLDATATAAIWRELGVKDYKIDDFYTFTVNTHDPSTGAASDAAAAPTYRVYEDETATPILTGTMALLDSANTAGFYSERIQLTAANGFEAGKSYNIYISATVGSVVGTTKRFFKM